MGCSDGRVEVILGGGSQEEDSGSIGGGKGSIPRRTGKERLLLHLSPSFMWGRCVTPCSSVVHIISRQAFLSGIIPHSVKPSSLRISSRLPPLYFHSHCPPSYVVLLASHHMSIPPYGFKFFSWFSQLFSSP